MLGRFVARRGMSAAAAAAAAATPAGPVAAAITTKLGAALQPTVLNVVNESHKHAGHSGNPSGAPDAETHFRCAARGGWLGAPACPTHTRTARRRRRVEVVSAAFEGKNAVARHRMVYELLKPELDAGLHALALKTKTPAEVQT